MAATRSTRHIRAPRAAVYRALLDADAVARWRFPEGMACVVHSFEPREGGAFWVSLTYCADRRGQDQRPDRHLRGVLRPLGP